MGTKSFWVVSRAMARPPSTIAPSTTAKATSQPSAPVANFALFLPESNSVFTRSMLKTRPSEVAADQTLPESWTEIESVITVLRRNEDVGVDDVSLRIGHHKAAPSLDAYSWKAPPRSPVKS